MNNLLSVVALHEESETRKLECDICDSGDPPANRCTTCSHFLCEFCSQAHQRARNTRSHTLVSLEEAKKMGSAAVTKPAICQEHDGEVMKLFCNTCEEAICRDCIIIKHRDHKYTFVKDAFAKGKENLLKILSEAETKATSLTEAVAGVLEMKDNVNSYADETVQEVVECFTDLTTSLNTRCHQLVTEIGELKNSKLKSLEIQQEQLETALASLQSSLDFTKKALENGSEVEILNMQKYFSSRLQDLTSTKCQLEPCINEGLKFKNDKRLKRDIDTFGAVADHISLTFAFLSTVTMEKGEEGVMYKTLCGQSIKFVITAKEHTGRRRMVGGDTFNVFITPAQSHEDGTPLNVQDCGGGTYSFCHTPMEAGNYKLSVQLKNRHVRGSPFTWVVEKWSLALDSSEDSKGQLEFLEDNMTALYKVDYSEELCIHPLVHSWYSTKISRTYLQGRSDKAPFCVGDLSFMDGKHMWRVQIHGDISNGFSFGIIASNRHNAKNLLTERQKIWIWNSGMKQYPDEEEGPLGNMSIINNCISGDIIELYLDCERRTLKMFNPRTAQTDTWEGVEGEVSPLFQMTNNGDKVSLKIKSEQQNYEEQQRTLKMFNPGTTAQTDAWEGVEGEVPPLFQMTNDGDKVSLAIKSEQQNYEEQQWNEQCATPKGKFRKIKVKKGRVKTK